MFEHLKQMNAEMEALKKSYLEKSKEQFTIAAKEVFDAHPTLESFRWTQYTPYFNDGDTCEFTAHIYEPILNGEDDEIFSAVNVDYGKYDNATRSYPNRKETPNPKYRPDLVSARETVAKFLKCIDESVLKDMFGDHAEVTCSRSGTEVEKYNHD